MTMLWSEQKFQKDLFLKKKSDGGKVLVTFTEYASTIP